MSDSLELFYSVQQRLDLTTFHLVQPFASESFVFVSIDLEFNSKRVTQLGVSTFDSQLPNTSAGLQHPVSNEYPIASVLYSTKVCLTRERRRKPSHFGKKYLLTREELRPLLVGILTPVDEQGNPRDVVLVGHNIASDIAVIERVCGLNIHLDIPSVKAVLDTQCLAQLVLKSERPLSLKDVLVTLGLNYIGLHIAAHDSRYTLRALLFMFCITVEQQCPGLPAKSHGEDEERRLALIKKIAQFHKRRGHIVWCDSSPRVKFEGNPDLLDQDYEDSDIDNGGLLCGIVQDELDSSVSKSSHRKSQDYHMWQRCRTHRCGTSKPYIFQLRRWECRCICSLYQL